MRVQILTLVALLVCARNIPEENARLMKMNSELLKALSAVMSESENAVGESENFDDYFEQLTSGKCVGEAMLNEIGTSNKDALKRCSHAAKLLNTKFLDFKSRGSSDMRALDKKEYPLGCSYNPDFNTVYYNPTNPNYSRYNHDASDTKRAICLKSVSCKEQPMEDGTCCQYSHSRWGDLSTDPTYPEECCEGKVTMKNTCPCKEQTMEDGTCCQWSHSRWGDFSLDPTHPEECCEGKVTMKNTCPCKEQTMEDGTCCQNSHSRWGDLSTDPTHPEECCEGKVTMDNTCPVAEDENCADYKHLCHMSYYKNIMCPITCADAEEASKPSLDLDEIEDFDQSTLNEVKYTSSTGGKCQTRAGGDPKHEYYSNKPDCEKRCTDRKDCYGYSMSSPYNNCLLWTQSDIMGGGDSWGNAGCSIKNVETRVGGPSKESAVGTYEVIGMDNHVITFFAIIGALSLVYYATNAVYKKCVSNGFTHIEEEL